MIVVHLDAVSLARVRLAVSPAAEAISWLRLAATNNRHPIFGDPGPAARTALREPDVALLAEVVAVGATGYTPDLVTPKPPLGSPVNAFGQQLELIRHTPEEAVARQLAEVPFPAGRIPAPVRHAMDDGSFARRAATGLRRFWRATLAEQWDQLKATLDVDLAQRASTMAGAGLGRVLGSLHRQVHWTGTELHILKPYRDVCHLNGAELVLAPSALAWPKMYAQVCDPRDAVLIYPAAGLAASPRLDPGLPRLLGASRAAVLGDLDVARSTHELSRRHALAPATVSYHLGVLLRAGLITRSRDRRRVLYRRNDRGDALLNTGTG